MRGLSIDKVLNLLLFSISMLRDESKLNHQFIILAQIFQPSYMDGRIMCDRIKPHVSGFDVLYLVLYPVCKYELCLFACLFVCYQFIPP